MDKLPQVESISRMKHQYNEVLTQLDAGPVVLTQHGRMVAVLVAPATWDAAVEEREDLKDIIAALRAELAIARGEEEPEPIDPDTFMSEILGESVPA